MNYASSSSNKIILNDFFSDVLQILTIFELRK